MKRTEIIKFRAHVTSVIEYAQMAHQLDGKSTHNITEAYQAIELVILEAQHARAIILQRIVAEQFKK